MNQTELVAALTDVNTTLTTLSAEVAKIGTETAGLLASVATLEAAVTAAGNLTPEVVTALAAVQASVTAVKTAADTVDALVPDAVVVPPVPVVPV